MLFQVLLDEEEIDRLRDDAVAGDFLGYAEEIVAWASGIGEPPAWGAFFYAYFGRFPGTLEEWTLWRDENWDELQTLAPR